MEIGRKREFYSIERSIFTSYQLDEGEREREEEKSCGDHQLVQV